MSKYPFFYVEPRNEGYSIDVISDCVSRCLQEDFEKILQKCHHYTISRGDIQWIMSEANMGSGTRYDPVALVSCFRILFHRVSCRAVGSDIGILLQRYLTEDPQAFIEAAAIIIKNNYVITKNCADALNPGLLLHKKLTPGIKQFIKEESGHDAILLKSLKTLPTRSHKDIPFPQSTSEMMSILKEAATSNAIAFLSIIGCFEGESYTNFQKLYDLLEQNPSTKKAVAGLKKHDFINQRGGHHLVGLELAKVLPPIDKNVAINACYLFAKFLYMFHDAQKHLHTMLLSLSTDMRAEYIDVHEPKPHEADGESSKNYNFSASILSAIAFGLAATMIC